MKAENIMLLIKGDVDSAASIESCKTYKNNKIIIKIFLLAYEYDSIPWLHLSRHLSSERNIYFFVFFYLFIFCLYLCT